MNNSRSKVCYKCPRRTATCRTDCPDYAKERAANMEEYARRRKTAMVNDYVRDEKIKYLRGSYKSKGWKRKR